MLRNKVTGLMYKVTGLMYLVIVLTCRRFLEREASLFLPRQSVAVTPVATDGYCLIAQVFFGSTTVFDLSAPEIE